MSVYLQDADVTLYQGDVIDELRKLPDGSVHMCCTSPPFYGLRDYGTGSWEGGDPDCDHVKPGTNGPKDATSTLKSRASNQNHEREPWPNGSCGKCGARRVDQQIGLEATPDLWVARLVEVFREVRRVLRSDGTCWIECGDSFMGDKQLGGMPWRLAFALQDDGWILRSDIVWARPNPMPESVRDRPTKSHSYVFLLSKSPRYFFDQEAIREPLLESTLERSYTASKRDRGMAPKNDSDPMAKNLGSFVQPNGRNVRSVWTIPTQPLPDEHYAAFPERLVERCILAGTSERGVCPECGAPWERVTEHGELTAAPEARIEAWNRGKQDAPANRLEGGRSTALRNNGFIPNHFRPVVTTGWRPTCGCFYGAGPVPATVLDPFIGSGTTALVARRHGRRTIGIELSPAYCAIAARRLQQLSLLA